MSETRDVTTPIVKAQFGKEERMADIKQAARWMRAGKKVRRASFAGGEGFFARPSALMFGWIAYYSDSIPPSEDHRERPYSDLLTTDDLLADDWEIAE